MSQHKIASEKTNAISDSGRRQFGRIALGGMLGGTAALKASARIASGSVHKNAPGIKLCAQSSAKPTDEELLFLKQIGAEYVSVGSTPDLRTAEGFLQIKKRYADAGITVWNIGNTSVHNMSEVTLNLPGRDQKIEEYKQYLRNLGKAGVTTRLTPIWETASGAAAQPRFVEPPPGNSIWPAPIRSASGMERNSTNRYLTGESSRSKKFGTTTPTSSNRLFQ